MNLDTLKNIHFIGIGGIGMSAVARFFNQSGSNITGYDKTETTLTKKLESEGMEIHFEDDLTLIPEDLDLVVYTPAVPGHHKQLSYLKKSELPVLKRSEVLGIISRAKKCVAVAGTHGKTTTSSMTAHLLKHAGLDISCFLGGIANNFGSNYCYGESEWTVIEADEFDRSFHTLSPEIAILISMDPDHLDIYGAKDKMQESFETFLLKVNAGGKVIMQEDLLSAFSESFLEVLAKRKIQVLKYGTEKADFEIDRLRFEGGVQRFDFISKEDRIEDVEIKMPGAHNASNMAAAMSVAKLLKISNDDIKAGVKTFSGIKRRFDIYHAKDLIYIDDYAHHPSELKAAISSARAMWPEKKIVGIFQPHLFSRTKDFMEDFATELSFLDELILMEIYPARELPIDGVNAKVLLDKVALEKKHLVQKEDLMNLLDQVDTQVLMTLGAGDIDVFVPQIRDWIKKYD